MWSRRRRFAVALAALVLLTGACGRRGGPTPARFLAFLPRGQTGEVEGVEDRILRKGGVLSVFVSEGAPASALPTPVPLHVLDFATGPVFEVHAGQDLRVTDLDGDGFHVVNLIGAVGAGPEVSVQSRRWLHQGEVVATEPALSIRLPVGSHTLVHEATAAGGREHFGYPRSFSR